MTGNRTRGCCTGARGRPCGNPAVFAVYTSVADATGACGKHLAQVTAERIGTQEISVKVTVIRPPGKEES